MSQKDILKLIFHHDQRLEDLAPSTKQEDANPLEAFTKPDPTYSTLYFSGTDLENDKYGINTISTYVEFVKAIEKGFEGFLIHSKNGIYKSLVDALEKLEMNEALVISNDDVESDIIHSFTKKMLRDVLEKGWIILYKLEAKNGFDIHLFSKKNIYKNFFYNLQAILPDSFRFFSINGKRLSSEKQFYFETWTLEKPPHGFEEVFPESVL
ncbi:MAG: hypothetical protein RLN90_06795 [Balneolaceae bacterium]